MKFSPNLQALLNASTSKKQWAQAIINALGPSRTMVCKREANASATDVWATGTEFYRARLTGAMQMTAGDITDFGVCSGVTVRLSADLSTGKSVLRIEGNGYWMEGTLGLTGSGAEFLLPSNPTSTTGIGFSRGAITRAPRLMPSGTGPAVPPIVSSAPASVSFYDWTNPASPSLLGTIAFNHRIDDFVYEDPELAASTGDVAVFQSTQSVMHGVHEFGATLLVSNPSNTEAGNVPLYQVMIPCAHRGTWTSYPGSDTYDFANHSTFPLPFKAVLKDADGNILHTFEQRDGLPINSPSMSQVRDSTHALRPLFTCAMQLVWQNTRPRLSNKAHKYFPGIVDDGLRPSVARGPYSVLGCEPLLNGGYNRNSVNGQGYIYAQPQWPRPWAAYSPGVQDPYVPNGTEFNRSGSSSQNSPWAIGWGYEPGSFSGHNWYTGPGGPRSDRSVIPSVLALWMSTPNGSRTQEGTPWRDMADGFLMGYFNHSNHWVKDVKTMLLDTNAELLACNYTFKNHYYANGSEAAGPKVIRLNADQRSGTSQAHYDASNRMPWNGWGRDPLHSYANAGWGALLLNSPMHAIGSKFDTVTQFMMHGPLGGMSIKSLYMTREQAWLWLQHTIAWKLAARHPLGFTRVEIEGRFAQHLEMIYQQIYLPLKVNNDTSTYFTSLRNLGVPFDSGNNMTQGGGLGFYMAHVLQLMKQTGLWSVLYARGGHLKAVLDMQLENMDKYCFGTLLDTPFTKGNYQPMTTIPASWAEYAATYEVTTADFAHNEDGTICSDRDIGGWPQLMYPYVRRDYFPEFPHARLSAAVAKADGYEAAMRDYLATRGTPHAKTIADHQYRIPSLCPIKPPAPGDLGPA
jgi:hypothetical protein